MTEQFRLEDYEEPIRDMAKVALDNLYTAIHEEGLGGGVTGHSVATERTPTLGLVSAATTAYRSTVVEDIDPALFKATEPPTYLRYMASVLCDELAGYLNARHNSRGQMQLYPPNERALQQHIGTEWFSLQNFSGEGEYDVQLYHTNVFYPIGLHLARHGAEQTWNVEYGYRMDLVFPHAVTAEMPGEVTLA